MTMQAIEQLEWIKDPSGSIPDRPFGYLNTHWMRLKGYLREGDQVRPFHVVPDPDQYRVDEYRGYALVREGQFVDVLACRCAERP